MSNELSTPKVLLCPSDASVRTVGQNFNAAAAGPNAGTFTNGNVSYFVCGDASDAYPQLILAGDRNIGTITTYGTANNGSVSGPNGGSATARPLIDGAAGSLMANRFSLLVLDLRRYAS